MGNIALVIKQLQIFWYLSLSGLDIAWLACVLYCLKEYPLNQYLPTPGSDVDANSPQALKYSFVLERFTQDNIIIDHPPVFALPTLSPSKNSTPLPAPF